MARPADLLSVDEAQARILSRFGRLDEESVALGFALGRVLSRPLVAAITLPPFANSSMDGFALRSRSTDGADTDTPVLLRVGAHIAAGSPDTVRVGEGEAARIMTGAPLPEGTDSVVPFEEVEDLGDTIAVRSPVRARACVRPAGQDIRRGDAVLSPGTELHSPQIGLLAALGHATAPCIRQPKVCVLSTGDELVNPGEPLGRGQIYNSNTPMIAAAIAEAGGQPVVLRTTEDDPRAIARVLVGAVDADLLVTSGGASVGDYDHMKDVIGQSGDIAFWRVRVRPGKPLIFGSFGSIPIIGLPGNPTSAMVTFELFVRPAIRTMLGAPPFRPEIDVVVDDAIENGGGRRTYARVTLRHESGRFHARLSGPQDSAMLAPLAHADGLLVVPEDVREVMPGDGGTALVWKL